ncbi:putative glucoamylase GMY2 [Dactylonectria macrodidyma]|uniref:Glucoamylase n=1 Tax=Dactylonectria macrodidyma TaxID=307937 RepID=A0A9P9IWH9_9HYPO|nr:putative glucoamylase GMY2 [Dactylonectria macrodidyma]
MLKQLLGSLAAIALWQGAVVATPAYGQSSLERFITKENDISYKGVLANIGADGNRAKGAAPGAVVASPSKSDPDYWYTWTRDSALTYKVLIEQFVHGDKSLQRKIDEYVSAQAELQGVSNPSGSPDTGGLGEPKFNVNLTEFTGSWGRPQRDGPPLRATALTIYANWLAANGGRSKAINKVWPVIEKDLAYTTRYWNRTGYDLWEEINGSSFFTLSASHRALVEGAALAKTLGKTCPDCAVSAPRILCFLQSFWVGGYIDSNINVKDGRTGKDANSILSSIHTFDPKAKCTDSTFQPCSARALANHKAVVDSFRSIYDINSGRPQGQAAAVGRYSEDVYYDGNPWYLTTLAAAEQLYAAIYQWNKQGSIVVNQVSLPFFRDLVPSVSKGTYKKSSKTFKSIIKAVHAYADGFVTVVRTYTPADGSLAEQFDKSTGSPKSAVHLTWSYASFVGAIERRAGIVPPSWGESRANTVPPVCEPAPACDATMTFNVRDVSVSGQDVFVVGSITELANWSPEDGIALEESATTAGLWSATIKIPSDTIFEYKYIKKTSDGTVTWESDPNRRATSSSGCGSSGTLDDQWK